MPVGFWEGYAYLFLLFCAIYIFFGVDDLFVDLVAWIKRLRPQRLYLDDLGRLERGQQRRLAILVPAWREGEIIGRMLKGNLDSVRYDNYHFFVGAYPNDAETIAAVLQVAKQNSRVHLVVNSQPGPTSKGQMLNEVVTYLREYEQRAQVSFAGVVLHDSEDIIHPRSLSLISSLVDKFDFIQLPVFSFPVPAWRLVAGTYVDEFAEGHTKDLLVRESVGAALPSAGVGTFLSMAFLDRLGRNGLPVFNPTSLTEDYELGLKAHRLGFRGTFACHYSERDGEKDFIATREYFPRTLASSVRQKGRWTAGIALQGTYRIGWFGSLANRYFLYRDRKGLFCHGFNCLTYLYSVSLAPLVWLGWIKIPELALPLGFTTLGFMILRYAQRVRAVYRVYGSLQLIRIFLRVPVANIINALAIFRGVYIVAMAAREHRAVRWSKTEHELPELFGGPAWEGVQ